MRIVEIKVYEFEELGEEAQERVIKDAREWIADYEWWDSCYDTFTNKYDPETPYNEFFTIDKMSGFDLYRHDIDFDCTVKLEQLEKEFPGKWPWLKEWIECGCKDIPLYFEDDEEEKQAQDIHEVIDEKLQDLKDCMLAFLQKELDYLESDEHIRETLLDNDYEYTEEGARFYHL